MITITIDSLAVSLDFLKSVDFKEHLIFINDGHKSVQILSLTVITEDFEVNGMSVNQEVGYELKLHGEKKISFSIDSKGLKISGLECKPDHVVKEMPSKISQYTF